MICPFNDMSVQWYVPLMIRLVRKCFFVHIVWMNTHFSTKTTLNITIGYMGITFIFACSVQTSKIASNLIKLAVTCIIGSFSTNVWHILHVTWNSGNDVQCTCILKYNWTNIWRALQYGKGHFYFRPRPNGICFSISLLL